MNHDSSCRISRPNDLVGFSVGAYEVPVVKFGRSVFGEDLAQRFLLQFGHTVAGASEADFHLVPI